MRLEREISLSQQERLDLLVRPDYEEAVRQFLQQLTANDLAPLQQMCLLPREEQIAEFAERASQIIAREINPVLHDPTLQMQVDIDRLVQALMYAAQEVGISAGSLYSTRNALALRVREIISTSSDDSSSGYTLREVITRTVLLRSIPLQLNKPLYRQAAERIAKKTGASVDEILNGKGILALLNRQPR